MICRPVDENGDILPVLSASALLRGAPAAAQLVRHRLALYAGEWWENPAWGNEIPEMLQESRLTEADGQGLAAYLASYIRETPGVQEVRDVNFSAEGCRFHFTCVAETGSGTVAVDYSL